MSKRTWPEDSFPTAEQWRDWFLSSTPDEQLQIAQQAVDASHEAHRCAVMNHSGLMDHLAMSCDLSVPSFQRVVDIDFGGDAR